MGIVALPTYNAQEVEKQAASPRQDYSGLARLGQIQAQTVDMLTGAATGIGKVVIDRARSDEYNSAVSDYNAWARQRLTDAELNPLNTNDPRYSELESDDEKALPNLALYKKDREKFLEELSGKMKFGQARDAFKLWAGERWTAEQDGLTRFDISKSREVSFDNYEENFMEAVGRGNFIEAKDLADVALASDLITPKMYDDHLDQAAKDITKRNAKLKALGMGDAGLAWIADADNVRYKTYDGKVKALPLDEHEAMVKQFEDMRNAKALEQDTVFSDIFVNADTIEKVDSAIRKLIDNPYMLGTQKHTWSTWLADKRTRLVEAGKPGKEEEEDVVSALYSRLYSAKDGGKVNPGIEVPISEIDLKVKDPQQHQALLAKRNELQKDYESGGTSTREGTLYEAYRIANDPNMTEVAKNKWIDDHTKLGGGLSPDDGMKVRGWIKPYNDNPDRKRAMDAVQQAYTISMQNETDKSRQMKIALDLYNAENALDKMFNDPNTTKATIDSAVTQFLEGKVVQDIMSVLKEKTGGAGFPVASKFAGTARELETAREQDLFTQFPERGAEFETTYRAEALKQEQAELKRVGIVFIKQAENPLGDQVYMTADGKEYVVRQTREVDAKGKATMIERVYLVEYRTVNGKLQMRYEKVEK